MSEIAFTIHNKDSMLSYLISNLSILDDFELMQELINKTLDIEMQMYLQTIMVNLKKYEFNTTDSIKLNIIKISDPMQTRRKQQKPITVLKLESKNISELRHLLHIRAPMIEYGKFMTYKDINCLPREILLEYIKYMYENEYQ